MTEMGAFMNIVYVVADSPEEWNSAEWRCSIPARAIKRTGLHSAQLLDIVSFAKNTSQAQEICQAADVIVIQRNLFGPVLNAVQRWKARDKVVIADFDDAYQLMPPVVKNYEFWTLGKRIQVGPDQQTTVETIDPPPLTQFKWGLRLVHAATVPSRQLAEDWTAFTDIYEVPNYIEIDRFLEVRPQPHEGIIIGWGGSLSHLQSFTESGILAAFKRVCQSRPQVRIMICGDERVFQAIPLPPEQKIFGGWVTAREWPQRLANFDIGVAPLHGPYDQRRSWIKLMEYMVMKIPWVASDGPAYHSLRSYGWLVQNKPNAWERILLDMVDNLDNHRLEAAGDPFLFSLSQNIDTNVDKILALYQAIRLKNFPVNAGLHEF
jgi:glycosyltransferase involved in cell wall biosynthesis